MSKFRFAIVGCGVIHGTHIDAIKSLPDDAELGHDLVGTPGPGVVQRLHALALLRERPDRLALAVEESLRLLAVARAEEVAVLQAVDPQQAPVRSADRPG